ncbi:hypothetical protein PCI56_10700 [Plesiomonas shigelloides subsp. oncorhynchi]|nr:hypothetical protein [Plesiomonas shigelloides]
MAPETAALGAVVLIGGILLMARASAVRAVSPIAGTPQTTAVQVPTVSRVRLMATIGATALCTTGYSLADGMGLAPVICRSAMRCGCLP